MGVGSTRWYGMQSERRNRGAALGVHGGILWVYSAKPYGVVCACIRTCMHACMRACMHTPLWWPR